jgi:hypothetical protein
MNNERVYKMSFASVYPHYIAKAEKKGRTKAEVDEVIRWLTGYSQGELLAERSWLNSILGPFHYRVVPSDSVI